MGQAKKLPKRYRKIVSYLKNNGLSHEKALTIARRTMRDDGFSRGDGLHNMVLPMSNSEMNSLRAHVTRKKPKTGKRRRS
tara:strand:- start:288 stop:527 length:240 start_codon:yes stop_codon:yes gene_type:complete